MRLVRAVPVAWSVFKREWQLTTKDTPFFVGGPVVFTGEWWKKARTQIHKNMARLWIVVFLGLAPIIFWGGDKTAFTLWLGAGFFVWTVRYYYHASRFCHRCGNDFNTQRPRHVHYTFSNIKREGRVALCRECSTPEDEEVTAGRGLVNWVEATNR